VLVNPGEKAIKIDIAADLKAAYETLSGLQVKTLEMSPRSGTILLKKSP
jgi:hypothetical protein